jgi:hypothetical protein
MDRTKGLKMTEAISTDNLPKVKEPFFSQFKARYSRYGKKLNTHDAFKIMAVLLMIADQAGEYLLENNGWLRLLGRISAPLFFFLVGYWGRVNIRPSFIIYGVLLSLSSIFVNGHLTLNVLLNFMLIYWLLKLKPAQDLSTFWRVIGFAVCILSTEWIYDYFEYGLFGVLFAYSARLLAQKDKEAYIWLGLSSICYFSWQCYYFQFNQHIAQMLLLFTLMIPTYFAMLKFRLFPLNCSATMRPIALVLSRFSLEIYFYHLIIFQAIYYFRY